MVDAGKKWQEKQGEVRHVVNKQHTCPFGHICKLEAIHLTLFSLAANAKEDTTSKKVKYLKETNMENPV